MRTSFSDENSNESVLGVDFETLKHPYGQKIFLNVPPGIGLKVDVSYFYLDDLNREQGPFEKAQILFG